jgi:type II secretory pathway component PulF
VAIDEVPTPSAEGGAQRLGRRAAVALWTRSMATLLSAGVPLDRALAFTAVQAGHSGLVDAVRDVRRAVQGGIGLADALNQHARYFDPLFVATVAAGESSGALEAVFERLSDHLDQSAELRSQVTSALVYPVIMATVAVVGVGVLLGFVIPRFAAVLADTGSTLPFSTRALMAASHIVTHGWWVWLLLGGAAALTAPSLLAQSQVRRRWDVTRLTLPWLGDFERKYLTSRFMRTFGLLVRSGIPVLPALRIARASAPNSVFQDAVDQAAGAVSEGSALAPALAGALPPLALQMLAVGEESGQLDALCLRVADAYDGDVRRSLRAMVALIEPAMILIFGGLVGLIALAMLQAIYGVNLKQL